MDDTEVDEPQKLIESIELQHRQKTITTKQALISLTTILRERPELSNFVKLFYYKKYGFEEETYLFLQLINLCEDNGKFLCDKHVLCFLAQKIGEFCRKENDNEDNINYMRKNVDEKENIDNSDLESLNNIDNILESKDIEPTENNTRFLITYIDNNVVLEILNIFSNVFSNQENLFLLSLMYEIGFFELFFVINAEQTCKLINSIYSNKSFEYRKQTDENLKVKRAISSSVIEVKRKMFDGQIVIKNKDFVDNKIFVSLQTKKTEPLYVKILKDFIDKNFSYFLYENDIINLTHCISFAISYFERLEDCDESKHEFFEVIYTEKVLNGLRNLIMKDLVDVNINFYILLLKNAIDQKNYKIIISKLVCDFEINKKLFKMLESKNKQTKKNVFVVFGYFVKTVEFFNGKNIEKIDLTCVLNVLGSNSNIKSLFNTLNYDFEDREVVIGLVKVLYLTGKQENFYKISYLIIFRHVIANFDRKFCEKYFLGILKHLNEEKSNFVKLLFTQNDKLAVNKVETVQENSTVEALNIDDKIESSDESGVIFRKRLNIG